MSLKRVEFDAKSKEVVIVLTLDKPRPSSTGKTQILASSGGMLLAGTHDGQPVRVNASCIIPA